MTEDDRAAVERLLGNRYQIVRTLGTGAFGAVYLARERDLLRLVAIRLAVDILSLLASTKRAEIQADIDRRVKAQVASPGSEAAVRRVIEELRLGKPDYDLMSSALARLTRRQITQEQATMAKLGALQSLTFKGVGPAGPDIYQATFEKGSLEWRIWLNVDGSVDYFSYRAVPPPK